MTYTKRDRQGRFREIGGVISKDIFRRFLRQKAFKVEATGAYTAIQVTLYAPNRLEGSRSSAFSSAASKSFNGYAKAVGSTHRQVEKFAKADASQKIDHSPIGLVGSDLKVALQY